MKEKVMPYVVTCSEFDRNTNLVESPIHLEVIGLFASIDTATSEINKTLLKRKEKITAHYNDLLERNQQEINDTIHELAGETDPQNRESLRYAIQTLEEDQRFYEASKVPEMLIENGPDGELCEITARDDRLGWICAFDIIKMEIKD